MHPFLGAFPYVRIIPEIFINLMIFISDFKDDEGISESGELQLSWQGNSVI